MWLRHVAIFAAPGRELRRLTLQPGLNVVWAPDAEPDERVGSKIGHGAGKTLLVRMLRHVLGEPDVTSPDDAQALVAKFPDGYVAAEVFVDGEPWAVRRPFDVSRGSSALRASFLEEVLEPSEDGGYDDFLDALRGTLGDALETLRPLGDPWLAALAWMSRDQERRFGGPLRWRDRNATPSSKMARVAQIQRVRAIRSLLHVRADEDLATEDVVAGLEHREKQTIRKLADCEREVAWLSCRLEREGHGEASELVGQPLMVAAVVRELEAEVDALEAAAAEPESIAKARGALVEARVAEAVERTRLEALQSFAGDDADCGLCHSSAEQAFAHTPSGRRRDPVKTAQRAIAKQEKAHARAQKRAETAQRRFEKAQEKQRDGARKARLAWADARERLGRAKDLARQLDRRRELGEELAVVQKELAAARADRERALKTHAKAIGRVRDTYDFVVRRLAGQDSRGRFAVGATGFEAGIRHADGRRGTSPAMRVMETLALDLTALILASEGNAALPGFWIHDSPREADLARSHYDALYRLVSWLEDSTQTPGFQYLVTTTTRPPSSVAFRAIKLGAASNDELLLRTAL
ncbi:MAG: hypothetical protein RID81_33675 [Sandaracinaceae bacterium]|nr:MAG: hypothetical protein EVA89_15945 [Sandaracinaceae bacterium]